VPVQLRYQTDEGVQSQWVLLDSREKTIYLGENLAWVIANADGHGFYRTRYSDELSAKVTAKVDTNLTAIERFNLVNDAWACVQSGWISGSSYLSIVSLFGEEDDPNVWSILTSSLDRIHGTLSGDNRTAFEQMVRGLVKPALDRLGWEARAEESAQARQLRGSLVSALGTIGNDPTVQTKARELFGQYKSDKAAVPSDVVPALVRLVAHTGSEADYDEFMRLFESSTVPQEQVRYLQALARFQQPELLKRTLAAAISDKVRAQDAPALVNTLLANEAIAEETWDYVRANWDTLVPHVSETGLISMVSGVTALASKELEAEVSEFFAAHPVKGGDKAIAQSMEMLRVAVLFNERESAPLAAMFSPAPSPAPGAEVADDSQPTA
jgi:puromycin-sensitive aminopeptidase